MIRIHSGFGPWTASTTRRIGWYANKMWRRENGRVTSVRRFLVNFLCFKLVPKLYITTIVTDSHDPDPFWVWTMDCQYYEKIKIIMSMIWEDQKRKTVVLAFIVLLFYYFIILLCFVYLTYNYDFLVVCWGYDMCTGTAFGSLFGCGWSGLVLCSQHPWCYIKSNCRLVLNCALQIVCLFLFVLFILSILCNVIP